MRSSNRRLSLARTGARGGWSDRRRLTALSYTVSPESGPGGARGAVWGVGRAGGMEPTARRPTPPMEHLDRSGERPSRGSSLRIAARRTDPRHHVDADLGSLGALEVHPRVRGLAVPERSAIRGSGLSSRRAERWCARAHDRTEVQDLDAPLSGELHIVYFMLCRRAGSAIGRRSRGRRHGEGVDREHRNVGGR